MSSYNLVNKLSLKSMKAQPKKNSFTDGDDILPPRNLAIVVGRVAKYEIGQSTFGEFTKFKGSFEGTNVETGEVFKSGNCFLPSVVQDLIVAAVDAADGQAVDFAVKIGAQHSEASTGYEYTVSPLTAPVESDELSHLREVAMKALSEVGIKALPAPEKTDSKKGKK